nr:hypothetical protein [Planctomycetota bacterium]
HWAAPADFPTVKGIGYDFVVTTVDAGNPTAWRQSLDAAQAAGIRLIIGAWPVPYAFANGQWTVTAQGRTFLEYLASRSDLVMAVFVLNEPYWTSPFGDQTSTSGMFSADELRTLRTAIRGVWPAAKIYHDIGVPSAWAPGGVLARSYPGIGDRYADQTGIADYVGIWNYPFGTHGYRRAEALAEMAHEVEFVHTGMSAKAVILGQSNSAAAVVDGNGGLAWPTPAQLLDWNCAIRSLPVDAISWYVWKQDLYDDVLANHPEDWPLTTDAAFRATLPAPTTELPTAAALPDSGSSSHRCGVGGALAVLIGFATRFFLVRRLRER